MEQSSYLIRCTSCGTANRIPASKEGLSGRCGRCKATLPPLYYQPRHLTEQTFDDFVRTYQSPILAVFWAPW
jgi:thioredoxin 2